MPRIFSVRSLSSNPANQISDPFSNLANQSDLFSSYLTPGKHRLMTLGKVSKTMEFLTALNRNRTIACRLFGALIALVQTALVSRNVLPLRLPPNSMICVASPANSSLASSCLGVSFTGEHQHYLAEG